MIKVDENTCIGCGACIAIDPEHFDFNDKGISTVINQEATENINETIAACPVGAISVEATQENTTSSEDKIIEFPTEEKDTEEKAA